MEMADNLPIEIQLKIFKTLPIKSLIRFRSVSKSCKSLIDSPRFISLYPGQQHLLVRYETELIFEGIYFSIVVNDNVNDADYDDVNDDDTFPNKRVSVTLPPLVQQLRNCIPIGSSHGLLCFFGICDGWCATHRAVIWNPFVRKAVAVVVPNMIDNERYRTVVGFGVCRETIEPKLVKITHTQFRIDMKSVSCVPLQVEVFTLSTGAWRSSYGTILSRNSIYLNRDPVDVDGCLYFLACDMLCGFVKLIVSFDMTSEKLREVNLPDSLARNFFSLSMYKLRESLVVIELGIENSGSVYRVWMMDDDVAKSFKKLFTIRRYHSPNVSVDSVRGFRKSGEPLMEVTVRGYCGSTRTLVAYDPYTKSISNVEINGRHFYVHSYVETLLLLGTSRFHFRI